MVYGALFLTAFLLCLGSVPLIKKLALKMNIVERASSRRLRREQRIPLLGGVAMFVAFWLSIGDCFLLDKEIFGEFFPTFFGMFMGSIIILLGGVYDDVKEMGPFMKLLVQIFSALVLIFAGFRIEQITTPFGQLALGIFSVPVSLLWILFLINAINLLDGLDGLAAGTTAIIAGTSFFAALRQESTILSYLTLSLVGVSLGFLLYNFYPAKIFMGDTGSMFLGYSLAAISIMGGGKSMVGLSLFVPLMIMALPILDTAYAVIRRLTRRGHIFRADMEHIHHKLLRFVYHNQRKTVLILYFLSLCYGLIGISFTDPNLRGIYATGVLVLVALVTVRWFRNLVMR